MFRTKIVTALVVVLGSLAGWASWAGQSVPGGGQREIDQPPSDRLRGDFDGPAVKPLRKVSGAIDQQVVKRPADFPAFVVETVPKLGDFDVDAATTKEIRVTFSKPMMDRSWSWTQGSAYRFPEGAGDVHYLPDHRTCVMPVKLEPGQTYVIGINGARFNGFKDTSGKPALIYTIAFRTRAAK